MSLRMVYVTDQVLPRTATDAEQTLSMVAAFGRCGVPVSLVSPRHWLKRPATAAELAAFYEVENSFSVAHVRSLVPTFRGLEKVAHAAAAVRSEEVRKADVLYTRNLPTVLAALRLGRTPVVYETYRPWPRQRPRRVAMFRRIFKHPRFLGAVLHSDLAASSYRAIGAGDHQILVAHNGYDPTRLAPVLDREGARRRLGLADDKPIVVYTGHVSPKKGIGLILDLAEDHPSALFLLVGSKSEGPIERRASTMPNVRVIPWQPFAATVAYLYAADVLIVPPTRGPLEDVGNTVLPMKTFLYMAAGRPILGPATPDLQEVLTDGITARLVRPDDRDAAGTALGELLAEGPLRERLAAAARNEIDGKTWSHRAERILQFIESRLQTA